MKKVKVFILITVLFLMLISSGCSQEERAGTVNPRGPVDKAIQVSIRTSYRSDLELNRFDLNVSVKNGVVTISGKVDSLDNKDRALDIAGSVDGVVEVIDQVLISP